MARLWPESTIQKTRQQLLMRRYHASNGKVMFHRTSGERHFIYESELDHYILRMRDPRNSSQYVQYRDVDELLRDGWALLG